MDTVTIPDIKSQAADIQRVFKLQQKNQQALADTTARQRIAKLKKLHKAVLKYRQDIKDALKKDFNKHPSEVDLTEIYVVTSEIKHNIRYLRRWMAPKRVATPMAFLGSSSHIQYEPKGVVLIIAPWNFPVNLTFGPLVSAIAAGNAVILKPSEHTPHASAIMKKIVEEIFEENEVALFEGDVQTSKELLALPFNHIFFTGAPSIGKIVMKAAAEHLASVTLELGGKSPTIVDETANLDKAANRIAWAKYVNNGQICIAPDYVFVHESKKDQFVDLVRKNVQSFYGEDIKASDDYARMVNNRHFERVNSYVEDAKAKGGKVEMGGETDGQENYIAPTMMTNVDMDSELMKNEIFGPVLPVYSFKDLQEPIDLINSREKPLALYIYSKSKKNVNRVMNNTRAGGACINHSALHFYNNNLPFGGSNNSGIGKAHGWFGFEAFSNAKGVYRQILPPALEILVPPYNDFKQKIIDLTIKWF
jgi:aldehyde dehydrogenase (NAD+)